MLENAKEKQDREQGNIQYSYPISKLTQYDVASILKFTRRILFAWFLPVTTDKGEGDCRMEL